jgi:hypothetical protein
MTLDPDKLLGLLTDFAHAAGASSVRRWVEVWALALVVTAALRRPVFAC